MTDIGSSQVPAPGTLVLDHVGHFVPHAPPELGGIAIFEPADAGVLNFD
jgi:hypothetical protein